MLPTTVLPATSIPPLRRIASVWIALAAARSHEGALQWLERQAKSGDTIAMTHLAAMFRHGQGVARSNAAARYWCERAACLGHVPAMVQLAEWQWQGFVPEADRIGASAWVLIALRFARRAERKSVLAWLRRMTASLERDEWQRARLLANRMIAMIRAQRHSLRERASCSRRY